MRPGPQLVSAGQRLGLGLEPGQGLLWVLQCRCSRCGQLRSSAEPRTLSQESALRGQVPHFSGAALSSAHS